MTIWDIKRAVFGTNKMRLKRVAGYWQCAATKDATERVSYGITPAEAWEWWCFDWLGLAPPSRVRQVSRLSAFGATY